MSHVTNLMLTGYPGTEAGPFLKGLNEYLAEHGQGCFVRVDSHAGGCKALEIDVWLSATNYLPSLQGLVERLKELLPRLGHNAYTIQLFACGPSEFTWRQYWPTYVHLVPEDL